MRRELGARLWQGLLAVGLAASLAACAQAAEAPKKSAGQSPVQVDEKGLALDGWDTVSYFRNEGVPLRGDAKISHKWKGATWHFANAENRDLFAASPEKYAPAYGGYCAWAVSHDYTAPGDPEAWTLANGRLFLNYNLAIRERWAADRDRWIVAGDANWPHVLGSAE